MKIFALGFLACLTVFCGCGGSKPQPQVEPQAAVPAAPQINLPERPPYKLGTGDRLEVRFLYYPLYNLTLMVRPDGVVTIPYVGEVMVEGMPPSQLEDIIRKRYAEIVTEPEVSVIVSDAAGRGFLILGEVRQPGAFDIEGPMTILDAIARAGGVNYTGRNDSVVLIRRSADGNFTGTRINLEDILDGHGKDVYLMPRDVIYVPMTFIAKVDIFVAQFFANISPAWYFFIAGKQVVNPEGTYIFGR